METRKPAEISRRYGGSSSTVREFAKCARTSIANTGRAVEFCGEDSATRTRSNITRVLNRREARLLRLLSQAYLGRGELKTARDCLEQLRTAEKEQPLLAPEELAEALNDLATCYDKLGHADAATRCEQEARRAKHGHPFAGPLRKL